MVRGVQCSYVFSCRENARLVTWKTKFLKQMNLNTSLKSLVAEELIVSTVISGRSSYQLNGSNVKQKPVFIWGFHIVRFSMLLLQGSHPGSQPGSSTKVRIRIIRGRSLLFLPVQGGILCRLLIRDCKKRPMRTILHLIRG